jgi:ABC-2 type transport system ATP-binding protein
MRLFLNLLRPTEGEATVLGMPSKALDPATLARIGYVSENQKLPEWMTVRQLIDFCKPLYPTWDDALCEKLITEYDLPADRKLKHLSRGMKMKAALTVSLAYRPEVLFLDEPFSGLDPIVRDDFNRGVLEMAQQENWTVVLSSHDIEEVEKLADEIVLIDNGIMRYQSTTARMQERFRVVEVTLAEGKEPPQRMPREWMQPERNGRLFQFVTRDYREGETERAVREVLGDNVDLQTRPLSLRESFIVLVRHHKVSESLTREAA